MRTGIICSMLFIVLAAGFVLPLTTLAEGTGGGWGIVPVPNQDPAITAKGYFVYPMQPDARVSGQILVRNPGATPVTVDLTAVTAQTAQNGGSAFAVESGAVSGVAGWIELSERQATLAPGTERPISFSVHTPAGVKPGQYLAGIAASEAPAATSGQSGAKAGLGAAITINKRYIIGVQADIAGDWKASLSIPNVSVKDQPSGTVIGVELRNDGDVFLKPSGTVVVTDASGEQVLSQAIKMGTFVPGTDVTYPIRWPGKVLAGTYTVSVNLSYAEGKTATSDSTMAVSSETEKHAAARDKSVAASQHAVQPAVSVPAVVLPAVNLAPAVASGIQPWMFYAIGALFLLMIVVLTLNLLRGRLNKRSV